MAVQKCQDAQLAKILGASRQHASQYLGAVSNVPSAISRTKFRDGTRAAKHVARSGLQGCKAAGADASSGPEQPPVQLQPRVTAAVCGVLVSHPRPAVATVQLLAGPHASNLLQWVFKTLAEHR